MSDESARPYTVVVGVSGTSKSQRALEWGAAQAAQNDGRLVALRAWRTRAPMAIPAGPRPDLMDRSDEHGQESQASLEADVAAALGPDHAAECRAVNGGTFNVLMEAAADADLLVVDAPRQLIAGPMFAHRLVYAAPCPVVLMPPHITDTAPTVWNRLGKEVANRLLAAVGTAGRPGYRRPITR